MRQQRSDRKEISKHGGQCPFPCDDGEAAGEVLTGRGTRELVQRHMWPVRRDARHGI